MFTQNEEDISVFKCLSCMEKKKKKINGKYDFFEVQYKTTFCDDKKLENQIHRQHS